MDTESVRMTTAAEAAYRVPYPNSKQRAVKVIALDHASAALIDDLSQGEWNGAAFFPSLSLTPDASAQGGNLHAWLKDLAGRALDLVDVVSGADFVVVVCKAGADTSAVGVISDVCRLHHKSLIALVLQEADTTDAQITTSLHNLRPVASMLVLATNRDYVDVMLTALRA